MRELAAAYDPDVVAVQLDLVGSHDAPRLRTVLGDDVTGVRLATLLQMTLPGAPCIYYGDEIGLRGGNDPENRGAFPWDEGRWDTGLRDSVRAMTRLRATEPALRDSPLRAVGAWGSAVAFERGAGAARFVVAVNAGDSHIDLQLWFGDAPEGAGGHLASVELAGFAAHRGDADRRRPRDDRSRRRASGGVLPRRLGGSERGFRSYSRSCG